MPVEPETEGVSQSAVARTVALLHRGVRFQMTHKDRVLDVEVAHGLDVSKPAPLPGTKVLTVRVLDAGKQIHLYEGGYYHYPGSNPWFAIRFGNLRVTKTHTRNSDSLLALLADVVGQALVESAKPKKVEYYNIRMV